MSAKSTSSGGRSRRLDPDVRAGDRLSGDLCGAHGSSWSVGHAAAAGTLLADLVNGASPFGINLDPNGDYLHVITIKALDGQSTHANALHGRSGLGIQLGEALERALSTLLVVEQLPAHSLSRFRRRRQR